MGCFFADYCLSLLRTLFTLFKAFSKEPTPFFRYPRLDLCRKSLRSADGREKELFPLLLSFVLDFPLRSPSLGNSTRVFPRGALCGASSFSWTPSWGFDFPLFTHRTSDFISTGALLRDPPLTRRRRKRTPHSAFFRELFFFSFPPLRFPSKKGFF